jgi:hypothetical protein
MNKDWQPPEVITDTWGHYGDMRPAAPAPSFIMVGKLPCTVKESLAGIVITLPNGDYVSLPVGHTGPIEPMASLLVRTYLRGMFLAAERLVNQGITDPQELTRMHAHIKKLFTEA